LSDRFKRAGNKTNSCTSTRSGDGCFSSGMSATNYEDVEISFSGLRQRVAIHRLKAKLN
jgi:hypothetical protein